MKTLTFPFNIVIQARIFPILTIILLVLLFILRPFPSYSVTTYPGAYVYEVDSDIYDAERDSPINVSSLTTILSRDTIDDRFYPMRGSSNSVSLSLAGLTGAKFAKGMVDSRWYFPFKWGTAFSLHGSAGWAKGYGGDEVPVFQRFFLGGLDSLRGFEDREVGPKGKKGYLQGEYRQRVPPIYLELRRRKLRRRQDGVLPV